MFALQLWRFIFVADRLGKYFIPVVLVFVVLFYWLLVDKTILNFFCDSVNDDDDVYREVLILMLVDCTLYDEIRGCKEVLL